MINKSWVVIKYNLLNETKLVNNLGNQDFTYFFPKVLVKQNNQAKKLNLFPGYAFVRYDENKMHALNYTKGLNCVLKSGNEFSLLNNAHIEEMKVVQQSSYKLPEQQKPNLYSDAVISAGPLEGRVVKIIGYKAKDRISFMYNLLGRNLVSDIEIKHLKF